MDRAKTDHDVTGFLKVILGKGGRLIGATLVGDKAGEMIPIASLAIRKKMKLSDLLGIIYSYPTEAEIFQRAAMQHLRDGFKPWQGKLVKRLFLS
jgi:pyruvate/2-oxoglutarate dehydrogenase complex dihydrolipoamide dehydrogenase (E3) component